MIPLSEPSIQGNEWKYVKECLDSGWISSVGEFVTRFEMEIKRFVKRKHAIAVINGTSALHLSLLACGIQENDAVIVPTLTFVASANAVSYCKATPIFLDVAPQTLCLSPEKLAHFLKCHTRKRKDGFSYLKETNQRIRALIVIHLFGHPAEMDTINTLCANANITIIEDASESVGSQYRGHQTGSLGKVGCFSFNGNKIITAGGGGMVLTDDDEIATQVRHLSTQAKQQGITYDHDAIGYNYRLSNIHAAIGLAQFEQLSAYIETKRKQARLYKDLLQTQDLELLWEQSHVKSNFWFYTLRVPKEHKNPLIQYLISRNIQVRPIWKMLHTLPMYKNSPAYNIDIAPQAYDQYFNLPCSVHLKEAEIEFVVKQIGTYFKKGA